MKQDNSLSIVKESFWSKIKKIFIKEKIEEYNIEEQIEVSDNNYKNDFLADIKISNDKCDSLERLQYLIRNKQIKEEDLTQKQKEDLRKLYQSQINDLKESIEMYKHKIIRLKNKDVRKVFN